MGLRGLCGSAFASSIPLCEAHALAAPPAGLPFQTDWRERFSAVSSTAKALQERIEEMRTSSKEKDNTISRLKRRLKDLEEAFEKAYKLSDNKDARLKEENKMFQNVSLNAPGGGGAVSLGLGAWGGRGFE